MRLRTAIWLALCCVAPAAAQQSYLGSYAVQGRYSNGATTSATLRITRTEDGRPRVVREASLGSQSLRWSSGGGQLVAGQLMVLYEVSYGGGLSGVVSGSGGSNLFLGVYRRSADGATISERVVNLTRHGPESSWVNLSSQGAPDALHPFRARAHREASALASAIMDFRADVADYYEPGDEDYYRDDSAAAEAAFTSALWDPVAVPAGFQASQALASHLLRDPRQVVEPGRIVLLFDAQARLTGTLYEDEGETYQLDGSWSPVWTPTPAPSGPGVNLSCGPGGGISGAEAIDRARGMQSALVDFIMSFRADVADIYDLGDEDYYQADSESAERYFRDATYTEVPVPAGYTAHKAIRVQAADPDQVIDGTVTVLLDCDGKRITIVYESEGEVYDEHDI